MPGMSAPALSDIQRRLSSSGKPPAPAHAPSSVPFQMPAESENEDAQGYLSGHLSGSGLETADEDPEHDPSSEYEREDREADLYTATAIKSGYLHKKGERRRAWKKRFFVLRPRSLGYYKDSKEYKLLRQIPLLDIRTCAQVEVKKHDYVFGIVTKERTFYIQTSSTHERDEWVQAINTAIKQAKVMDQVQSESPLTEDLGDSETPQARASPGLTTPQQQQQQHQSPTTQPIAIAGASSSRSSGHLATNSTKATAPVVPNSSFQPHSLASITTGSSGFSPGALSPQAVAGDIPSSYTSQPSVGTQASSFGAGAPGAPPNSYALSPSEAFQQYDLANVDATLQQIQGAQQVTPELPASADKQRQYSNSSVSDANDPASAPRWFGQAAAGVASPGRPLSPGGGSSSEDEDDELGEMPVTPISSSFHQDPDALSARAAFQRRFSTGNTAQSKLKAQPGPAQMHHPESDKIILAGYLTKQGKRRNWRKRWFSLSNTSLSYSRSHMDTKVHHQIPLERVLDVLEFEPPEPAARRSSRSSNDHGPSTAVFTAADTSSKKYEHCFQIITPKRTLKLCATDDQSEHQWIHAIRQQLTANRQGSTPQPGPVYSSNLHSSPPSHRTLPIAGRPPSQSQLKQTAQQQQQQSAETGRQVSSTSQASSTGSSGGGVPSAKPQLPSIQTRLEQPMSPSTQSRSPAIGQETFVSSPVSVQTDPTAALPAGRMALNQRVSFQSMPPQPRQQQQPDSSSSGGGRQRSSTQSSAREILDAAADRHRQLTSMSISPQGSATTGI